jgi:hypothetical protein
MKVLYIDSNEVNGQVFSSGITATGHVKKCIVINDGKIAVMKLLDDKEFPAYIFVHGALKGIPCSSLILFLNKHDARMQTKVVVVSPWFSKTDLKFYKHLKVDKCLTINLTTAFDTVALERVFGDR